MSAKTIVTPKSLWEFSWIPDVRGNNSKPQFVLGINFLMSAETLANPKSFCQFQRIPGVRIDNGKTKVVLGIQGSSKCQRLNYFLILCWFCNGLHLCVFLESYSDQFVAIRHVLPPKTSDYSFAYRDGEVHIVWVSSAKSRLGEVYRKLLFRFRFVSRIGPNSRLSAETKTTRWSSCVPNSRHPI